MLKREGGAERLSSQIFISPCLEKGYGGGAMLELLRLICTTEELSERRERQEGREGVKLEGV